MRGWTSCCGPNPQVAGGKPGLSPHQPQWRWSFDQSASSGAGPWPESAKGGRAVSTRARDLRLRLSHQPIRSSFLRSLAGQVSSTGRRPAGTVIGRGAGKMMVPGIASGTGAGGTSACACTTPMCAQSARARASAPIFDSMCMDQRYTESPTGRGVAQDTAIEKSASRRKWVARDRINDLRAFRFTGSAHGTSRKSKRKRAQATGCQCRRALSNVSLLRCKRRSSPCSASRWICSTIAFGVVQTHSRAYRRRPDNRSGRRSRVMRSASPRRQSAMRL